MSMFNIFNVAAMGMVAQTVRLNTTASNMANVESAGSSPSTTFKAKHPVFAAVKSQTFEEELEMRDNHSYGVKVTGIVESNKELQMKYDPNHPKANEEGYIFLPNVNIVEEMANMISASRTYQSNVQMLNTAKDMIQQTLSIGR